VQYDKTIENQKITCKIKRGKPVFYLPLVQGRHFLSVYSEIKIESSGRQKNSQPTIQAMQSIHAVQSIQAPAHMRMKDLAAEQRAEQQFLRASYAAQDHSACRAMENLKKARAEFRKTYRAGLVALLIKQNEEKAALRQQHHDARQRAKEEKDVRRQQQYDARQQAKVEKAFLAPSKLEPNFWMYYPNHDGRCDTLTAVFKSKGICTDHVTDIMPVYAKWLLEAKKTSGVYARPMSRWALMTAFADEGEF